MMRAALIPTQTPDRPSGSAPPSPSGLSAADADLAWPLAWPPVPRWDTLAKLMRVGSRHLIVLTSVSRNRDGRVSDSTDQEVISKLPDTPIHMSSMSSTGTPSRAQHNEPAERTIR
jgi:hypothetical protein